MADYAIIQGGLNEIVRGQNMGNPAANVVYFIQAENGLVKIGFTKSGVKKRLAQLRTGGSSPMAIRGTMDGDKATEAEIHRRFRDFRSHGEWFRCGPEIDQFIADNCRPWVGPKKPHKRPPERVHNPRVLPVVLNLV